MHTSSIGKKELQASFYYDKELFRGDSCFKVLEFQWFE